MKHCLADQIHSECTFCTKISSLQSSKNVCCLMPEAISSLTSPSRCSWPTSLPPFDVLTHSFTQTHSHTYSYMLAHVSHTCSSRMPRHWWMTALPLCCTLLHLELWASCIFNRGNLHRHCVCRCMLCQWDCLSPYLHSPLTESNCSSEDKNPRP